MAIYTGTEHFFKREVEAVSDILRAIKDKMDELGVLLVPEIDYSTFHLT